MFFVLFRTNLVNFFVTKEIHKNTLKIQFRLSKIKRNSSRSPCMLYFLDNLYYTSGVFIGDIFKTR